MFQADISSWAAVRAMAEKVDDEFGKLDVLINNVGDVATEQMSWRDITQELIDRVIDVDIKGTMYMLHEFGSRMLDHGGGAIVNVGSTVIVRGSPRAPQYAAGKYGILGSPSPTPTSLPRLSGSTPSPRDSWRPRRLWPGKTGTPAGVRS